MKEYSKDVNVPFAIGSFLDDMQRALWGRHIHVAGTTVGQHIDKCAECGRDLRDPIHIRYGESA